jgi:hypothetical protein
MIAILAGEQKGPAPIVLCPVRLVTPNFMEIMLTREQGIE